MMFESEHSASKFLLLLLLADVVFILLQVPYHMGLLSRLFFIEKDRGYAEVYQYIKEYWIILLLFIIAVDRARSIYLAWSSLFIYLLMDDSLQVHETLGMHAADYFGFRPAWGLRAQDFGEIGVSLFFGALLFAFIGMAYIVSDNKGRELSKHLLVLMVLLAFFGIVVDTIHVVIPWGRALWGVIEEGGEMMMMSVILWYVFKEA